MKYLRRNKTQQVLKQRRNDALLSFVPDVFCPPLVFPQGSDAWHGDVSAALVSWQWWPGAARPLPFFIALHLVSQCFFHLFIRLSKKIIHIICLSHTQVGRSVRGSIRPPLWLRSVLFCNTGGPWPRVSGHPGQLPYLWECHHVVEHERQHFVHTAKGSCAVCSLHTTR